MTLLVRRNSSPTVFDYCHFAGFDESFVSTISTNSHRVNQTLDFKKQITVSRFEFGAHEFYKISLVTTEENIFSHHFFLLGD